MDKIKIENVSFFVLFGIASILVFLVFWPFFQILALAAVFAILFRWPYEKLLKLLGNRATITSLVTVLIILVFFIVPIFILGTQIFHEAQNLYTTSQSSGEHYTQTIEMAVENPIRHWYPAFSFSVSGYVTSALSFISDNLAGLLSQTLYLVVETSLMLLAFFFFLRDGEKFFSSALSLSPFRQDETDEIFSKLRQTISSIIRGTLVVALVRWLCFSVALYLCGIPDAILWGSIGGIIGAIPGLGTLFVVIPAVIFLYLQGSVLLAIGFAVFGLSVMVFIDNALTTHFFRKGLDAPAIFVIFSLLGGVLFFGPMGFILGPLVLSLFLSTLHMYKIFILQR